MKCWYCKGKHMHPFESLGKGWYKCSDCGATWREMTKLFFFALATERDEATGRTKYKSHPIPRKRKVKA